MNVRRTTNVTLWLWALLMVSIAAWFQYRVHSIIGEW